jgi:hypothetical protein
MYLKHRVILLMLFIAFLLIGGGAGKVWAAGTVFVTNGSTQIGTLPATLPNTSFRVTTSSLNSATVATISANFVGPSSTTLVTTTGWTQIQSTSSDDASLNVPFGFSTNFNTSTYNGVYVGSNTYLTFGSGSSNYSGLSASNPAIPGVHMCAADNSYQKVFYKLDSTGVMRVRYEGNNATSGTVGSPTIVYEAVFYSGQSYFDVHMGPNSRCGGDTTAPTVSSVTSSKANGSYTVGEVIPITVTFSENVTSTGNVTVTLETGATDRTCTFTVSSSTTGTCNYTVQSGDTSSDLTVSSISGTIRDTANNAMSNYTPSTNLAANKALVIDTTAPTVTGVTSSTSNGSYRSGQVIPIQVNFSENVTVSGTPQILLVTTSPVTTAVNYSSGSGTSTLTFNYTVASTNSSADLDFASTTALSLNGSTIKDSANNAATLTLATPGASNSLAANKALVIDNTVPTVTISTTAPSLTKTTPIPVTAIFSESVSGFAAGDVSVTNGSAGNVSGSGASYTFDVTPSSQGTVTITISGSTVTDSAGNANTASDTLSRSFDNVVPTVTLTTAISSPTLLTPIPFTATFSENVTGFSLADVSVTNATTGNFVAVSETVYTFDVSPIGHPTLNVDVTVSVSANSAEDAATNGNTASNSGTPYSIRFDNHSPTTNITTSASELTNSSPITISASFSETVTGFDSSDITVTNASTSGFTGSGTSYSFLVTPSSQGAVTVRIPQSVAQDGATNLNLISNLLNRIFDTVAPTVAITSSATTPTSTSPIPVTVTFSENVTGFTAGDLSITNGSASNFSGSGTSYTFTLTPSSQGDVTVAVPIASAHDTATNGNSVSNTLSRTFDSAGPILAEVTAVSTNTSDTTPDYTFSSSEAGTITYSGDCSSSTTTAISGDNTITFTTLSEGFHNNCGIVVTDALSNASSVLIVQGFTITDAVAPVISSLQITPSDTSATITWTTDELASSRVEYGLVASYGFQTAELNTGPRVTSHSVSLSNLKACARYYYRVKSLDQFSNQTTSNSQSFKTTGCAVSSVDSGQEAEVTTSSGGQVQYTSGSTTSQLTIPPSFSTADAAFQINRLENTAPPAAPTGTRLAGENLYQLIAVNTDDEQITTFDEPITFTINYGSDVESRYDESTLDVYRFNGTTWDTRNCALDTSANTLTCSLSSFSIYGVFGTSAPTSTTSSSVHSTSVTTPTCTNSKPAGIPDLFQIDTTATTARLAFTPISTIDTYYISYSTNPTAEDFGTQVKLGMHGVQSYTVESLTPGQKYYFKVRGQNGCMPGDWSTVKSAIAIEKKSSYHITNNRDLEITQLSTENSTSELCNYTVASGDSLRAISKKIYSDENMFAELIAQNKLRYPNIEKGVAVGWKLNFVCPKDILPKGNGVEEYDVTITVENQGKPLANVAVELHSDPKYGTTDENGKVTFTNVEKGEHSLHLAYEKYTTQQKIVVEGERKELNVTVAVEMKQDALLYSRTSLLILISVLLLAIVFLYMLKRNSKKKKH